ncbi:NAD(P)/FAD-dependent oxidoreductase [Crateriforma conspicua]|uniref:D-amino acid dehydrogenase small subunit n=1 Tax=Crateriforma conspicua TaxID=2527996 RepID=A0A5C6FW39_9PLAN|nr:FAD-dependent oxidoreductase [Crateriforma conspicua]TWU67237.1 D-amino acid dehydrogenase small subunit [Crateriforma conspicua]
MDDMNPHDIQSRRVVIIGGGIIGVAAAHFLKNDGHDVVVVDKGSIGGACSHGNCGLVCPSHVLPLAEPGAPWSAIRSVLNPASAFRVKPRLDPSLWSWFWNFNRRCNQRDMLESATAIQPLLLHSMRLYQELVSDDAPTDIRCDWTKRGLLFVYRDAKPLDAYAPTDRLLGERFNESAVRLGPGELVELEPALRDDLAGGWWFEHDAHLRPDKLLNSWVSSLHGRGVRFIPDAELTDLVVQDGVARHAKLKSSAGNESVDGDVFLFATGAWTPLLSRWLKMTVPIQPGKGYSITLPAPAGGPQSPMIFPQHRVAVTPMNDRLRLGSIMEFVGYDESIQPKRLRLLTEATRTYLRGDVADAIDGAPQDEAWQGWRPMTYDSTPVIGRCGAYENVYVSAGHNMLGISMAPASGQLIASLISGTTPALDPTPYRPQRFAV